MWLWRLAADRLKSISHLILKWVGKIPAQQRGHTERPSGRQAIRHPLRASLEIARDILTLGPPRSRTGSGLSSHLLPVTLALAPRYPRICHFFIVFALRYLQTRSAFPSNPHRIPLAPLFRGARCSCRPLLANIDQSRTQQINQKSRFSSCHIKPIPSSCNCPFRWMGN